MTTVLSHSRQWVNEQVAAGKTSATLTDPNCMLPDIPAITATGLYNVTLVHPQIVQFSMHHSFDATAVFNFAGQTYSVLKVFGQGWGPDIGFALLDRPVVGVQPLRTLLAPGTALTNLPGFWYVRRTNRMQLVEVRGFNVQFSAPANLCVSCGTPLDPTWRIGTKLVQFDSGAPLIAMIDGEPLLLCTAYSPMSGSGIHNYYEWVRFIWRTEFGIDAAHGTVSLKLGDFNDDNSVDFQDFLKQSQNFGRKTDKGHNEGDADRDGDVDMDDFLILSQNIGK